MGRVNDSTTANGTQHEEAIVDIYSWDNARRSRSSGAASHDPVDVTSDSFVIECECTDGKSKSLTLKFWREVFEKQHSGKKPMLAYRFRLSDTRFTDLVVMDAHDHSALMEELEAYRNEAITRD